MCVVYARVCVQKLTESRREGLIPAGSIPRQVQYTFLKGCTISAASHAAFKEFVVRHEVGDSRAEKMNPVC